MSTSTSPAAAPGAPRSGVRMRTYYWIVAPMVLLFAFFHTFPVLTGVFYSFTNYAGFGDWKFIGLSNYANLFRDDRVLGAYGFSFLFAITATILTNVISLVIALALFFDFTNGFHDTANAMATSIATGALKPKVAVTLSAILNLIGAFLSVEVALTVTNAVVRIQDADGAPRPELIADGGMGLLLIILAGLVGAILWNLLTWLFGLPSSSSHALFGGLIGAGLAALGTAGINWTGVIQKVLIPAVAAPFIAGLVAAVGTWLVYRITRNVIKKRREEGFRWGQIATASLVALSHGTNDAQKTMGIITLALIATGSWTDLTAVPFWVKLACALAIALGTYIGGWRIIRTLGKGLVEISAPQGMAAESSSAAVILASSHLGFALSTTHVATGSILGSGVGKRGAKVNWNVAVRMLMAWGITLPAAGAMGALTWFVGHTIGGLAGATYIDKMDNFARKVQQGEPTISAVTDRIYLDVGAHPEYATAECDSLLDLVAQDRAGERILDDISFSAPDRSGETVTVDAAAVQAAVGDLARRHGARRAAIDHQQRLAAQHAAQGNRLRVRPQRRRKKHGQKHSRPERRSPSQRMPCNGRAAAQALRAFSRCAATREKGDAAWPARVVFHSQSRKLSNDSGVSSISLRISAIAVCRSSRLAPVTRTLSSWMAACTLSLLSLSSF